jgi:hypothetical protein
MARFADKLHVDTQKIDRVESAVLLAIIVGGLALCVLGAAISRYRTSVLCLVNTAAQERALTRCFDVALLRARRFVCWLY